MRPPAATSSAVAALGLGGAEGASCPHALGGRLVIYLSASIPNGRLNARSRRAWRTPRCYRIPPGAVCLPATVKAEGIALDPDGLHAWIALDADDATPPSELCLVRLHGEGWRRVAPGGLAPDGVSA